MNKSMYAIVDMRVRKIEVEDDQTIITLENEKTDDEIIIIFNHSMDCFYHGQILEFDIKEMEAK